MAAGPDSSIPGIIANPKPKPETNKATIPYPIRPHSLNTANQIPATITPNMFINTRGIVRTLTIFANNFIMVVLFVSNND